MRIRPTDRVFAVVDPTEHSELADCVFETTLSQLHTLVDQRRDFYAAATLYDDEADARRDAGRRILAAKVARAIAGTHHDISHVAMAQLFDKHGALQLTIEV
jgi:cation transport regulator ChaB